MSDLTADEQHSDLPYCRWQVRIHDSGMDFTSPEFDTYAEMRQWESDCYERNRR